MLSKYVIFGEADAGCTVIWRERSNFEFFCELFGKIAFADAVI